MEPQDEMFKNVQNWRRMWHFFRTSAAKPASPSLQLNITPGRFLKEIRTLSSPPKEHHIRGPFRTDPGACEENAAAKKGASSKMRRTTVARIGAARTILTPTAATQTATTQTAATSGENDCNHANNICASSHSMSSKAPPEARSSLGYRRRKQKQRSEKRAVQSCE